MNISDITNIINRTLLLEEYMFIESGEVIMIKENKVERLKSGKVKYNNEIFPGINKPKSYKKGIHGKGDYKKRVLAKEGDDIAIVNFGHIEYSDFTKHKDTKRRKGFRERHNCDPVSKLSKLTAKYWSCQYLWETTTFITNESIEYTDIVYDIAQGNNESKSDFAYYIANKLSDESLSYDESILSLRNEFINELKNIESVNYDNVLDQFEELLKNISQEDVRDLLTIINKIKSGINMSYTSEVEDDFEGETIF